MMALLYRLVCMVCMGLAVLLFAVMGMWELLWLSLACLACSLVLAGRFGHGD